MYSYKKLTNIETNIINHFQYEYCLLDIYKMPQDFNYALR